MKKLRFLFVFVLILSVSQVAYGNMAAPETADVASSITFEKNDAISVLSEVLDITVNGSQADIVATYKMKNTTDQRVSTPSMFLSPNLEPGAVKVVVNGQETAFITERFALCYDTEIQTDDWQYVVLVPDNSASEGEERSVDTITFEMEFAPKQEYDVTVSYVYRLGGYPDYDFNVKEGRIQYYLAPAAMWKDFHGLTIHLYLDKAMPVIASSNLAFTKVGRRAYQFVSDALPEENLEIVIDENWCQNLLSTLRSPYLPMTLMALSPLLFLVLAVVALLIWRRRKKKKSKS